MTEGVFPAALGHEGAGIVVEVGEVTSVQPGDHVIPFALHRRMRPVPVLPERQDQPSATAVRATQGKARCPTAPRALLLQRPAHLPHYIRMLTFSEYTVVAEVSLARSTRRPTLSRCACWAVTTGLGAVKNTAKVQEGDTVAVVRPGGIGLAVVGANRQGRAHHRHRHQPGLFALARRPLAPPTVVNPKDHDKPIQQVIVEMTGWGVGSQLRVHRQRERDARRWRCAPRLGPVGHHRRGRCGSRDQHPAVPAGDRA